MVRKQRKASFIDKHCDQYGLKIVTRGPKGNVDSVVCRFCITFGREDDNDDCGVGNNNGSARKLSFIMAIFVAMAASFDASHAFHDWPCGLLGFIMEVRFHTRVHYL